jgi:heme-degrading monooxygenase HmoA|tara:strand:- start:9952 stop:10335 length:384 start_codon:yes stop_codon:yes gene_type:complete
MNQQLGRRSYITYMQEQKPVKILSTRISKIGHEKTLKKYLKELNKNVYSIKGFQNAESFWVPMSTQSVADFTSKRMITISEWKNPEDWENWLKSEIRLTTNEKYVDILEMEEHLKLEHILPPPIFLL